MSVIEFVKRFFKPSYTLLPEEEKEFSESEILLYAKKSSRCVSLARR